MHFLRAGTIYALANVAAAAVPFLLLPLLTRLLGPGEFGVIVAFGLWGTLTLPLAGMSVHGAVGVVWFRETEDEVTGLVGSALALAVLCTLATVASAVAAVALQPTLAMGLSPAWVALAVVGAGASVVLQCRLVLWQSQQRPLHSAALQVGASVFNVALSLLAVLVLGWGADGRNAAIVATAVLSALAASVLLHRAGDMRWRPRAAHFRDLLRFGLPLVPHALAGVLLATADRWLVSARLGHETLGLYGAAAQLGLVMSVLADAFVKAYMPWLYARLQSPTDEDRLCVVGAVYASVPAFALLAALLSVVLAWASTALLGTQYRDAGSLLPWFVAGGACSGIYFSISGLYFFHQRTGALARASVTAAVIGLPCLFWLVHRFGLKGAAMSFALTQALLMVCAAALAVRTFALPWALPGAALAVWLRRASGRADPRTA